MTATGPFDLISAAVHYGRTGCRDSPPKVGLAGRKLMYKGRMGSICVRAAVRASLVASIGLACACTVRATMGTASPPPPPASPPAPPPPPVAAPIPPPQERPAPPIARGSRGAGLLGHSERVLDIVGSGDSAIGPDGRPDGTFDADLEGPIDGLILVTTDAAGAPCCGQQWDTVVGSDPLPNIGSGFNGAGGATLVLGVWENGVVRNDPSGRVALGPGPHRVVLAGSPSGYFRVSQHFRLYVHPTGAPAWTTSNVAMW
jgi:hypothetical protein